MPTLELSLSPATYKALTQQAQQQNQSLEELVEVAVMAYLATSASYLADESHPFVPSPASAARQAKIHAEVEAWRAIPETERQKYQGKFVALHEGHVIDHDADRLALWRRVRGRLGDVPVLITPGGIAHPREFQLLSPRRDKRF